MPTALIVEDEPEANRLLTLLVQLRGYRTDSTLTGRQAQDRLRTALPDVIFLDLMLPDISGFELCQAIKSNPATSLVPIVVVSAALADANRARCFQLGALTFIPKPYVAEQIFEALAAADTWNRDLAQHGDSGLIPLDDAEEQFAVGLSRFKALLLARTPLGNQSLNHIVSTLEAIRGDARAFGSRNQVEHVATVAYTLREDRLVLSIRDESGWFCEHPSGQPTSTLKPELELVFDETSTSDSGKHAILTKHFSPPSTL